MDVCGTTACILMATHRLEMRARFTMRCTASAYQQLQCNNGFPCGQPQAGVMA